MSYTHLTEEERYHIDELLRQGVSQSIIATKLCRSKSTLSRELRRNKGQRGWRPQQAHKKASERLSIRGVHNTTKIDESAWEYAVDKLVHEQWSPEQINGRQQKEALPSISHESIYQRILSDKNNGGDLYTHLRCKKKRKKRYGSKSPKKQIIPNRIDIDERPNIVNERTRIGDWEGDTVIGSHTGGAVLATMVERKSRLVVVAKSQNKTTKSVIDSIITKMEPISELFETATFDNGPEFANHEHLATQLHGMVYFAKPYRSWERGVNENTNGLLRQYFPKKTSFDSIEEREFECAANKINNRPRKCLGFETPCEVFRKLAEQKGVALRI